jgi:acyl-homoserine-lactone acylase
VSSPHHALAAPRRARGRRWFAVATALAVGLVTVGSPSASAADASAGAARAADASADAVGAADASADAVGAGTTDPAAAAAGYEVEIRRTEFGIPHLVAEDFGSLGYGYAYALAEDNLCTVADLYMTVNGDRSRFFGPAATWSFNGNGTSNTNLESDAFYRAVNASGRIEELLSLAPPHGPRPEIREAVTGYVAGYNRYLEDIGGADGIGDPRCAGAEWVRPIDEIDVYRRFYQLASLASTGIAIDEIGGATPPTPPVGSGEAGGEDGEAGGEDGEAGGEDGEAGGEDGEDGVDGRSQGRVPAEVTPEQRDLVDRLPERFNEELGIGSNAYGFGRDATADGSGLVLGNPHFPWTGGERFYQAHLTIPGVVDVQGGSLFGVPVVLIGTTEGMAWSHTVSTAFRFTPFQLTLVPGSPTTYLVDGEPREMEERRVVVPVRDEDGEVEEVERSVWWTDYGPVITGILGLPLFPWTPAVAFAMGDANDHMRYLNHFFETNLAQSVRELYEVQTRNQGVPWVNTIAADSTGEAYYADISVVPNVPDEKVQACPTPLGVVTFAALGLPVLDGSRSDCGWDDDGDAVVPGIFGPSNLPHLFRDDFVHNGNDSYWLTNPAAPLEGFARIVGDERAERTLRTRVGLLMVEDRLAGADDHTDLHPDRWTKDVLEQAALDNRQYAGELTRDDLVALCETTPVVPSTSAGPVATDGACAALAGWDVRDDVGSTGAILFRRFWQRLQGLASPVGDPTGTGTLGIPWRTGFDPDDAVHTPNTLETSDPRVATALGDAIADLERAGIPLDAPLGDWQYVTRDGERIPIHGGPGNVGVFNAINVRWQGDPEGSRTGYGDVPHGTSFIQVVTWPEGGDCPVDASAFVTYGNSEDPTSPHSVDQTRRFSAKEWIPMRFCEEDVLASPELVTTRLSSSGSDPGGGDDEVGDERLGQHGRDRAEAARSREAAPGAGKPQGRASGPAAPTESGTAETTRVVRAAAGTSLPAAGGGALLLLGLVTFGLAGSLGRGPTRSRR